jgi:hypothetical protein
MLVLWIQSHHCTLFVDAPTEVLFFPKSGIRNQKTNVMTKSHLHVMINPADDSRPSFR